MSSSPVLPRLAKDAHLALMWVGGGLLVVLLWALLIAGQISLLCAVILAAPLLALATSNKEMAVLWTLVYLMVVGDIRRIVAQIAAPATFDPLLIVAPTVTAVLVIPLLLRLRLADPLSKSVFGLAAVMCLEIANPIQGPITIGLSGVFFYLVPVMWFWIGRSLGSADLVEKIIYRVILPVGICAGVVGTYQNFIGFLPYQQTWITEVGRVYTSLYVGSSVRAFGFSTSAAEYATLLEFSIAVAIAAGLASRLRWIAAVPLLATALLLSGGRGLTIKIVLVIPVLWLMRRGKRLSLASALGMLLLAGVSFITLSFAAAHFEPTEQPGGGGSAAQDALAHQLGGLAHPFDEKYSSAGLHSNMVTTGLMEGIKSPLGHGLGSTTFAAQKFGADTDEGSSELDFSDMFISLGLLGGLLYIAVAVFGIRAACEYVRRTPLHIGLPVLAILIATLGGWLIEGQYSTCSIAFFILGSLVYKGNGRNTIVWNKLLEQSI